MSLLMDALKRAETTKQEAARSQLAPSSSPASSDLLSLEPMAVEGANGSTNPLPDLATYIEAVDADLASTPLPAARTATGQAKTPPPVPAATETRDREVVRNAFAAKQTTEPKSRLPLWLALGTLGLAGAGIGGYVWYQFSTMNKGSLATNTRSALPAVGAPPAPAQPATPPPIPAQPPADLAGNMNASPAAAPLFASRSEPRSARTPILDDSAGETPIRLIRTRPDPDANLARGHSSLQRGETELARRDFEQAVQRDPNNTDALLALDAIAHRSDPATMAAALNGAAAEADPQSTESRLKTLLSSQPDSAPLNFALGNLYSRQNRWPEAQQVYFNAVAADGDNPDYLFNLAVSLDHLRQGRLAVQHYRLALEAGSKRPAAFDRNKVEKRIGELQAEPQR